MAGTSVRLSADGVTVTHGRPPTPMFAAWSDITDADVAVCGIGGEVTAILAFGHESGHRLEVSSAADGWRDLLANLGDHMTVLVADLPAVVAGLSTEDAPVVVARRVDGDPA